MDVSAAGLFLLFFAIAETIKVVPKTEFEDNSPGINPDHTVTYLNKEVTSISPGVVKAVLEVNLGGGIITDKRPNKTDKKNTSKKNRILICNDEGKCKYHEIKESDDDTDDDNDDSEDGKKLKPIIVTGFDKDPLGSKKDKDEDDDDYDKTHGKKIPKVPVRVGYKGAVTDYSFNYPGNRADGFHYPGNNFGVDRLPAYYGMKLSPEFHQPYPGPVLYDDTSNIPPYTGFNHGHGPSRTPTPYGQFYPTRRPGTFPGIITSTGWSSSGPDRPVEYWPSSTGSSRPGVVSPGTGSRRPGVYWPKEKPVEDPNTPPDISVRGKMDFDEDELISEGTGPTGSADSTGSGGLKVDGKLRDPFKRSNT